SYDRPCSGGLGHDLGLRDRPRHLARVRAAPVAPHRRGPAPAARDGRASDPPEHARPLVGLLRRARRQRARAQPGPRPDAPRLMAGRSASVFSRELVVAAIRDSFPKLDPRLQVRNPVMFIVELGSAITTVILVLELARGEYGGLWFVASISVWLWLTVLFANFAEAVAEGRGKAQANALRATRTTTLARRRNDDGT